MNDPPPAYPADFVKSPDQPPPPPIGYQPQPMVAGGGYPQPVLQQPHLNTNNMFGTSYQAQAHRGLLAMLPMKLGRDPVQMRCPSCMTDITTEVRITTGMCAWIIGIILCSFL